MGMYSGDVKKMGYDIAGMLSKGVKLEVIRYKMLIRYGASNSMVDKVITTVQDYAETIKEGGGRRREGRGR